MAENETARQSAIVTVHSITPDVCVMPSGNMTNFFIVSKGTEATNVCADVNATGDGVMNMSSLFATCSNDEAGAAGVMSGTILGQCEPIENMCRVRANGQHILRDGDIVWMNNRNCLGIVKILFPKKTVILSTPSGGIFKGSSEQAALNNLKAQYPDADVVDPSKVSNVDLSQYENVIVQGHGGSTGAKVGLGGNGVTAEQLSQFLNENGFQGSTVELAACNTGTSFGGEKPFAERLSQLLGVPVTGYPHEIMIKPGGIIRRMRPFGNSYADKFATQAAFEIGAAKPTPKTFPGK